MSGNLWKRITGVALCGVLTGTGLWAASAPPAKKTPSKAAAKPAAKAATPAAKAATPATPAFVDNTPLTEDQKIAHVLNRLGFGPRPGDAERVKAMGLDRYIDLQLTPEKIDDKAVEAKLAPLALLAASPEQLTEMYAEVRTKAIQLKKLEDARKADPSKMGQATPPNQQALMRRVQQGSSGVVQLQMAKVVRAVDSERQLQEVLVDFWTNHFNVDVNKNRRLPLKIVDDREVIRPHTLGKFRDLLGASAKSPAMLFYLDNAQSQVPQPANRKGAKPGQKTRGGINENYAREIMELHTLGVDGGYTQKDVQEVARCLTGWSFDRSTGRFRFNERGHDDGEKVVLGRRIPAGGGIQDGETVLDILAAHPSTAKYVSRKLCQRFVSDQPPAALVDRCAAVWKKTGGDLRAVVRTIVTSPEFFSRVAYRQKIKSPFEFAVSSVRALGGTVDLSPQGARTASLQGGGYQRGIGQSLAGQISVMGEPLFQHQAPTGYPEDSRKWVSSGALISRLNFSLGLMGGRVTGLDLAGAASLAGDEKDPAAVVNRLADRLLRGEVSPSTRATLLKQATDRGGTNVTGESDTAKRVAALVLGSPEFQRR